jgi:hypothetical protein
MKQLIAAFAAITLPLVGYSQWGGGSCGPVGSPRFLPMVNAQPIQRAPHYEWKASYLKDDEGRVLLFRNGNHVGTWDAVEQYYRAYDSRTETWGPREDLPPVPMPGWGPEKMKRKPIGQQLEQWQLKGVDREKVHADEDYTISGRKVSRFEALLAVGNLDDDSGKMWLLLIGDETARKKALADLKAEPKMQSLLSRVRIVSQPANHFAFQDRETGESMYPPGNPTVYLGEPDGGKLFLATQLTADDMEALRKKDPLLKPDPVKPDPKKPDEKPDDKKPDAQTSWFWPIAVIASIVVGVLAFFRKKD